MIYGTEIMMNSTINISGRDNGINVLILVQCNIYCEGNRNVNLFANAHR